MNPVLSDLSIRIAFVEVEARAETMRQHRLARDASSANPRSSPWFGLVRSAVAAMWQFVDPRGFAMRALDSATIASRTERPATIEPAAKTTPHLVVQAMGTVSAMGGCRSDHRESKPAA